MGGSLAGISAALLAARAGHDVTVLERGLAAPADPEEAWDVWPRLRQPHAFLPGLRRLLLRYFPEAYRSVLRAGAVELLTTAGEIALGCRRTTLELALRQQATAAGLRLAPATTVTGLDTSAGGVSAVHVSQAGEARWIGADLAIDATGRHSKSSRWLPGGVRVCAAAAKTTVWSRFYRADARPPLAGGVSECAMGPGWCWYGLAADAGVCSLSRVQLPGAARPGAAEFESAAATVPFARALLRICAPVGPVRGMPLPGTVMRRCHVPGLVLAGDALLTTDPAYGLGALFAVEQAVLLAGLLGAPDSPAQVSRRWDELTAGRYEQYWQWAAAEDARRISCWRAGTTPAPAPVPRELAL